MATTLARVRHRTLHEHTARRTLAAAVAVCLAGALGVAVHRADPLACEPTTTVVCR